MSERNIKLIKQGKAPIAPNAEQKNVRRWYEIHHISLISKGGDVYGIDNLGINTPAQHDRIHQEMRKDEEGQ